MKTLIVDDHGIMRKMVRAMLEPAHTIFEAGNGQEALAYVRQNADIGLILTDFNMPVMNGVDFIAAVRRELPTFKGHVVFISSIRDQGMKDKTAALGANLWLHKPFKKEELMALLATLQ